MQHTFIVSQQHNMQIIDLRSDTVTQPCPAMRDAMHSAVLGDDVYGDDLTVNNLEALAARMLGTEAALFAPSGTQTNLLALLCHCQRGDEYIVGQQAHTYRYESGGGAVVGGIQPQPLDFELDGTLDLDKVAAVLKPDDPHFVRSRLLCLENTHAGIALPLEYFANARAFCDQHQLRLHLDGARLFNAAVLDGVKVDKVAQYADSISICLSKGLGAPVGSVLCASHELIAQARRWRKMLGGGMRQAGVIAAAGVYALENNVQRLAKDHQQATELAKQLSEINGLRVVFGARQTNMVMVTATGLKPVELEQELAGHGIKISPAETLRLVLHLGITANDIDKIVQAFSKVMHISSSKQMQ